MNRGKFIVFEGVDGSGKSTQIKLLVDYLFNKDKTIHIYLTREPGNSRYYSSIRRILKEDKNPYEKAEELTELYVADRKAHAEIIEYNLNKGNYVICDRYKYSTLAYQQTQGISLEKLIQMHRGILIPDLTLIIDVSIEKAMKRINRDDGRTYQEIFEKKDFLGKVRENYLKLREILKDERIVVINGEKTPEEVFKKIKEEVDKIL